jgi:hypothetical protein
LPLAEAKERSNTTENNADATPANLCAVIRVSF